MAIPDYQSIMLPLLKFADDEKEHSLREAIEILADGFNLTEEERKELLPSGRQATFDNRVGWARTYMKKAGLLKSAKRGYFQITERGLDVLKQNPPEIDNAFLRQFPEFIEFQTPRDKKRSEQDVSDTQTPEEEIEAAYQGVRQELATELLQTKVASLPFLNGWSLICSSKWAMVAREKMLVRPLAEVVMEELMVLSRKIASV
jgi:restriction system protein